MSVIRFSKEEIADLYISIEHFTWNYKNQVERIIPLNYGDYLMAKFFDEKLDEESYIQDKIKWWIQRLWASNQMASIWQYHDKTENHIEVISVDEMKQGRQLPNFELYQELNSLRYNLYTNGGNCFVQEKDLEMLDSITSGLERREARRKFEADKTSIEAMRENIRKASELQEVKPQ